MRVLVQRVTSARVSVGGAVVAELRPERHGLLALVGVTHGDDVRIARTMAERLWRLRILDGDASAADLAAPVLLVSQFTLYGDTTKGRRPSWNRAAPKAVAQPVVEALAVALGELGADVATGTFGADMQVESMNDGPMTVLLDS